jgi:hypothetical protein
VISSLALIPLLYQQFKVTPPNTFFTFAHNYIPDYYQYLSWMKDGADGKILITSRYSPQNFARQPVYLFYSALGWLTRQLAGRRAFMAYGYTAARILLGLLRLLVIYWFISLFFKKRSGRLLAFSLALFLPPFYNLRPFSLILPNLTSVDILRRTFFLPHDMATTISLIIGSILFTKWIQFLNPKSEILNKFQIQNHKYIILCSMFFVLSSICNPAMTGFFLLFLAVGAGLTFLQSPSIRRRIIIGLASIFLTCGPIIFYYQNLFANTLPLSWFYGQQKLVRLTDYKGFWLLAGPAGILGILGVLGTLKRKDFLANLIIAWAMIPFLVFPLLGKILPLSQERIFEMSIFLPLAILSTFFIENIRQKLRIIFLTMIVIFTLPYLYLTIKNQIKSFAYPYFNVYIPNPTLEAFNWLDQNSIDESVVLSSYFTANMIPAFTHNKVFFGHDFVTYQAKDRLKDLAFIFDPQSDSQKIAEILKQYQVKYLLLSPESPHPESAKLLKIGLKLVFDNKQNQIYKFGP